MTQEIIEHGHQTQYVAPVEATPGGQMLGQFMPKDFRELTYLAKIAAQAHFLGVERQDEALCRMVAGAHLGITPYAALQEIILINGRPVYSAQLQAALIQQRGGCVQWDVEATNQKCTITFRSREWREAKTVTVALEDVDPTVRGRGPWKTSPSDMLYATAVRRVRKRYYPAVMMGVGGIDAADDYDPSTVVDMGSVEEVVPGVAESVDSALCPECGAGTELIVRPAGGAYLHCPNGHNSSPPQAVRDAIRGHKDGEAVYQQEEPHADDPEPEDATDDPGEDVAADLGDPAGAAEAEAEAGGRPAAGGEGGTPRGEARPAVAPDASPLDRAVGALLRLPRARQAEWLLANGWTREAGKVTQWMAEAPEDALDAWAEELDALAGPA